MPVRSPDKPMPTRCPACSAKTWRCDSSMRRRRVSSSACSGHEEAAMSLLDFLRPRPKTTANIAREPLRKVVLAVIRKYVHVGADAVQINVERSSEGEVLELSVAWPEVGKATGTR